MKCRSVRKLLPELVSGELDEMRMQEAMQHINACAGCAKERDTFETALGALSRPHEMIEVPAGLDFLRMPASQRKPRLGLALAGVACVVALVAAVILMPYPRSEPRHQVSARIPKHMAAVVKIPIEKKLASATAQSVAWVAEHHALPRKQSKRATVARQLSAADIRLTHAPQKPQYVEPETSPSPVVVVAWRPEAQQQQPLVSKIEIESVNHETGETSVCIANRDASGNERNISLKSNWNRTEDRGI
jgi:hypothetical protein